MTKAELVKALAQYPDDIEVVAGRSPGIKYSVLRAERRTIPDLRKPNGGLLHPPASPVDVIVLDATWGDACS